MSPLPMILPLRLPLPSSATSILDMAPPARSELPASPPRGLPIQMWQVQADAYKLYTPTTMSPPLWPSAQWRADVVGATFFDFPLLFSRGSLSPNPFFLDAIHPTFQSHFPMNTVMPALNAVMPAGTAASTAAIPAAFQSPFDANPPPSKPPPEPPPLPSHRHRLATTAIIIIAASSAAVRRRRTAAAAQQHIARGSRAAEPPAAEQQQSSRGLRRRAPRRVALPPSLDSVDGIDSGPPAAMACHVMACFMIMHVASCIMSMHESLSSSHHSPPILHHLTPLPSP